MESREEEPASSSSSSQQLAFPAQPDCLLTIGSQHLAAVLAEEWDTGLLVLIQGSPLFWVDDIGTFQTSEAEIAVRVSNIVNVETDDDDLDSNIPVFRIGLVRLDQPPLKLRPQVAPAEKTRPKLVSRLPLDRIRISVSGLIAFSLLVTPLAIVVAVWRYHAQQVVSADAQSAVAVAPQVSSLTPPNGEESAATFLPAASVVPEPIPEPTPEILQLPGVEPFLKLEVAKKLELTPQQMGAFGRMNRTTQEALADLEKYWESDGRLELAQRRNVLLEAARREALQVLTDRQRQTWEAMTR